MSQMYTLKVNIRAQQEREKREKERLTQKAISKIKLSNAPPTKPRKRKGLDFHQPGTFIAKGEQLRKKAKLEALQKRIAASAAKTGIADAAKLASLTTAVRVDIDPKKQTSSNADLKELEEEEVPEIEWWDKPLLGPKTMDQLMCKLNQVEQKPEELFTGITNLVEHPPIVQAPGADLPMRQIPIFLTKEERKKLRRQNRKNLELEKQEKIKLGLLPKPEPKLKRSNIMYALGDEAITNPSLANKLVRDQEEKRLQAHLEHNESKKATYEEKKAKKVRKIEDDLRINGIWVSVYRVFGFTKRAPKRKMIEKTARQPPIMTGALVLYKDINLVVVEGSTSQHKDFRRMIMPRQNKDKQDPMAIPEEGLPQESSDYNKCLLVWEGQIKERSFRTFQTRQASSQNDARKYFKDFNVEHYWDLAFKMSVLESIDDT